MTDFEKRFRFRKFPIYIDSRRFGADLKRLTTGRFPPRERFCLLPQLWRASDSVVLNIAEGSECGTDKNFAHFLSIARASLNEVVACLDIALDNDYISEEEHVAWLERASGIASQLTAFRKKLLQYPTK